MQMYGSFEGFPLNSALFGLVSYNDPCHWGNPALIYFLSGLINDCSLPRAVASLDLNPQHFSALLRLWLQFVPIRLYT